MPWPGRTAVVCAALAALLLMVATGFLVTEPTRTSWFALAIGGLVVPATSALSVLVTRRRDGAVVGLLLGLLSLSVAAVVAKEVWLQWLAVTDDPGRWGWMVASTAENAWWILATFALLLLHFPNGKVPSPRWRWVPRPSCWQRRSPRLRGRWRRSRSARQSPISTARSARHLAGGRRSQRSRSHSSLS